MKKLMKRFAGFTALAYVVLAALMLTISNCASFDFEMKPAKVDAIFAEKSHQPDYVTYQNGERSMHYVAVGDESKPLVLFVHGSPGSWDAFVRYMGNDNLLARARMASVDRPGFGKSGRNIPETSMERQAADIAKILTEDKTGRGAILVGHSLGGPVIARMAMDFPEKVAGLILVAPSIDPELEEVKWYQVPAEWWIFSWMIPKVLLTTNREILPLKAELQKMLPLWRNLRMPVTVIQGGKDRLVPKENADFAEKMLVNAPVDMVRIADMNHFVPWNRPDLIEAAIHKHLDGLETVQITGE
ncbi:MAG: alpha/beta hydrolase [Acidobacteriota bacterium]|nr:alpha/beta hydrolase [Acidobacteriota bacterium]